MIIPEDSEIEEEEPKELEKLIYGKTTLRLLNINGNYQIEKRNQQGVVNIIDYTRAKTFVEGVYNTRLEDTFIRIKQARRHINQFEKERQDLALRVDDLEMLNPKELGNSTLGEVSPPVLEKPMVFKIWRNKCFTSHLDFLDVDETV